MKNAFKLFDFKGTPVYLKYWFFLILLFIDFNLSFFIAIFIAVLVHELAHTFVAKKLNYHVEKVFIDLFYGGAEVDLSYQYRHKDSILIIGAGPISNLIMYLLGYLIIIQFPNLTFINDLNIVNLFLFLFNILPIYPMDGGRITKALFCIGLDKMGVKSPNKKGKLYNGYLSLFTVVILLIFCIVSNLWFLSIFSIFFIYTSYNEIVNKNSF